MSLAHQFASGSQDAIERFCRTCVQCNQMDTLVSHLMTLADAELNLDAIALILVDDKRTDEPSIRVAARGAVAPNVRNRIKAYCSHVITNITGIRGRELNIDLSQVNCSLPLHDVQLLTEARILWSIQLGPTDKPWGAIALFASQDCGIEPSDLNLLERICPIVEETVERINSANTRQDHKTGGVIATIRVNVTDAVGALTADDARDRLIDDVFFKVARILPSGSGIARLGDTAVGILAPAQAPSFREGLSQTLTEILSNHQAPQSIRIDVDVAHTTSVEETSTRSVFPTPTNQSSVQLSGLEPVTAARTG